MDSLFEIERLSEDTAEKIYMAYLQATDDMDDTMRRIVAINCALRFMDAANISLHAMRTRLTFEQVLNEDKAKNREALGQRASNLAQKSHHPKRD